jgi:hypothetical protein
MQMGPRFNRNLGTSCYGSRDLSFDPANDPQSIVSSLLQRVQANGVYYGSINITSLRSVVPGGGIPAQPPLSKLFFDASLGADVYVEQPVDVGFGATDFFMQGFDYNQIGLAHIGLEPDMLQDVANGARRFSPSTFMDLRYQMRYLMRSAEDFIEAWERSVAWCRRSGSPTCGNDGVGSGDLIEPDSCDIWASDVDAAPTITDSTPSCMARCGQTLTWMEGSEQHFCRCWTDAADAHPTDLCGDYKPWCQWHFNGGDQPDGRVRRSVP